VKRPSPRQHRSEVRSSAYNPTRSGARSRFAVPVVLVVDDMEDNRDLVSIVLERAGYEIAVAIDGLDAIERARAIRPSLILMDLAMPNMDGFDATLAIRAIPELASVPIVALSAFADKVSVQRAISVGCNGAVAKPCTPETLLEAVESALRLRETRSTG
jgi:CheY-like chemotaxis protein